VTSPLWEAEFDQKVRAFRHRIAPGFGHALLAPAQSYIFEALGLSAAIWLAGDDWFPLHTAPSVTEFEVGHDTDGSRNAYNSRMFAEVRRRREALCGDHGGFSDFFVPLLKGEQLVAILVVGPFGRVRASATEVLERWRQLTGLQGHPEDPEFAGYLAANLATVVFDDDQVAAFQRLLTCWGRLATAEGNSEALANQVERDRVVLEAARRVDRMWEDVRSMVDDRFARGWQTRSRAPDLVYWGMPRAPDRALVGLVSTKAEAGDPVEAMVKRNAFQRGVVEFVLGNQVMTGRVGDHGVVLLAATSGGERARIQRLSELARRVVNWARREFGLSLHFGTGENPADASLSRRYQVALSAAQSALFEGKPIVVTGSSRSARPPSLWNLRRNLGRLLDESPERVEAHFDHYLEAVMAECGYRFETARVHVELGFERLLETLARQSVLDERSFGALLEDLERSLVSARNATEVFDHYRRAVRNLTKASQAPVPARHERGLTRALAHIQQHYVEPLRLAQVARIAGFAPSYFSKLFIQSERVPFSRYLTRLRVERAKGLLTTTELSLTRVARLSGFPSAGYLCTAFGRATGTTPANWRTRHPGPKAPRGVKKKSKTPGNGIQPRRKPVTV
jgi:AraC-like DNA-binding protein